MLRYVTKRILVTIPVLIGVTLIIFTLMYFTKGDPARMILGDMATEEEVQELREEMGLNDPFLVRYANYLVGLCHGDLGTSYVTGLPVTQEIMARLPVTARIAALSCAFSVLIGIPVGILSAVKQYSIADNIVTVLALLGITIPSFWLAMMLILLFSVKLNWLPASGLYGWKYYILPVISVSAVSVATITRMTRSSMLEVIRQDFIRTARAKGQTEGKIITHHALKNALIPIITIIGIQFASGLAGAVVNEQVFAIPGIGKMMVDAIKARNYPVVQGGVLVIAVLCSLLNLIVDLLYAFVDPRIATQYARKKEKHPAKEKQNSQEGA